MFEEGRQPRVLLIDDDVQFLQLMRLGFQHAGYDVRCAEDGSVGLALFQTEPADLVVTDMVMPVREGVETILSLKTHDPSVRIIAISGAGRAGPQDYLALARQLGVQATLSKPFTQTELLDAARRVLVAPAASGPTPPEAERSALDTAERWDDAEIITRLLTAFWKRSPGD